MVVSHDIYDSYDTYWTVDDKKTYSKIEAIMLSNGVLGRVKYHWMENTWDHVDFSKEPNESWEDLCLSRVQQLRDSHNYLCLWFSGGFDSSHILECFIKAQLPLDELVIFDQRSFYNDGEVDSALEVANYYKTHYNSKVNINLVDIGWEFITKQFHSNKNWTYHHGDNIRFTRTYFGSRKEQAQFCSPNSGQRADIAGFEKPRLNINNGTWQTFMIDSILGLTAGSGIIQFYCTNDLPELHVKQLHMAIKFFESNSINTHEKIHHFQKFMIDPKSKWYQNWNLALGRSMPTNYQSQLGTHKLMTSPSVVAGKDSLILSHAKKYNDQSYLIYNKVIDDLCAVLPNWDPWSSDSTRSLMPQFYSKFYNIGTVK